MSEYRKYPKGDKRQLIDYNRIMSDLGDKTLLCIDKGILPAITVLLGTRGLWRTSYIIDSGDVGYFIPSDDEFEPIASTIADFIHEVNTMQTCNDLVSVLEKINVTLAKTAANCQCSGGYGSQGVGVYETTESGFVDSGSNYPDGFENRSVYDDYKCAMANYIVSLIRIDLVWFQNFDVSTLTAGILAATLVTPIPFDDLVAIAILAGQLLIEATIDTMLSQAIDAIDNNREELVCSMYSAIDEAEAKLNIANFFETRLDAAGETFLGYFINNDALRWLFEKVAKPLEGYDCSGCSTIGMAYAPFAVISYGGLGTYQNINSINDNNPAWGNLTFNQDGYVEFGPFGDNVVTGVRIWAAEPSGGLQSVLADNVQVRGDGVFTGSDPNTSYPTDFWFDNDVTGPDVIRVTFDITGGDKPIYEVQFWYRI